MMNMSQQFGSGGASSSEDEDKEKTKKKKSAMMATLAKSGKGSSNEIVKGASMGSAAGPWGAAIGAVLGASKQKAANRKKFREAKAAALQDRAAIHTDTSKEKNKAISKIMESLRAALTF